MDIVTATERTISASRARTYKQCPRSYRYRYVLRFVPRVPARHLFAGRGGHEALAAYERGETSDPATWFREWVKKQKEELGPLASEVPESVWDECATVEAVLKYYPEWAQSMDDGIQVVVPEQPFRVPVYVPGTDEVAGWHEGVFDGLVMTRDGALWLRERKFASDFPNEEYLQLDEQAGYYLLAAYRLLSTWGLNPGTPPRGVLYDVIRKVDPKRTRSALFRRYRVVRGISELVSLEWNLYHTMQKVHEDRVWVPSPGQHCMWACPYRSLCISENLGEDPENIGPLLFDVEEPSDLMHQE